MNNGINDYEFTNEIGDGIELEGEDNNVGLEGTDPCEECTGKLTQSTYEQCVEQGCIEEATPMDDVCQQTLQSALNAGVSYVATYGYTPELAQVFFGQLNAGFNQCPINVFDNNAFVVLTERVDNVNALMVQNIQSFPNQTLDLIEDYAVQIRANIYPPITPDYTNENESATSLAINGESSDPYGSTEMSALYDALLETISIVTGNADLMGGDCVMMQAMVENNQALQSIQSARNYLIQLKQVIDNCNPQSVANSGVVLSNLNQVRAELSGVTAEYIASHPDSGFMAAQNDLGLAKQVKDGFMPHFVGYTGEGILMALNFIIDGLEIALDEQLPGGVDPQTQNNHEWDNTCDVDFLGYIEQGNANSQGEELQNFALSLYFIIANGCNGDVNPQLIIQGIDTLGDWFSNHPLTEQQIQNQEVSLDNEVALESAGALYELSSIYGVALPLGFNHSVGLMINKLVCAIPFIIDESAEQIVQAYSDLAYSPVSCDNFNIGGAGGGDGQTNWEEVVAEYEQAIYELTTEVDFLNEELMDCQAEMTTSGGSSEQQLMYLQEELELIWNELELCMFEKDAMQIELQNALDQMVNSQANTTALEQAIDALNIQLATCQSQDCPSCPQAESCPTGDIDVNANLHLRDGRVVRVQGKVDRQNGKGKLKALQPIVGGNSNKPSTYPKPPKGTKPVKGQGRPLKGESSARPIISSPKQATKVKAPRTDKRDTKGFRGFRG